MSGNEARRTSQKFPAPNAIDVTSHANRFARYSHWATFRRFFIENEVIDYEGAFAAFKNVKGSGKEPEFGVLQALVKSKAKSADGKYEFQKVRERVAKRRQNIILSNPFVAPPSFVAGVREGPVVPALEPSDQGVVVLPV